MYFWNKNKKYDTSETSEKKRIRSRCFVFTWNNHTQENIQELIQYFLNHENASYTFQQETGESGTKHLQGFVYFPNLKDFKVLKEQFPKTHWEIANNIDASQAYARKAETRTGKVFTNNTKIVKDPLQGKDLYPWQQDIVNLFHSEPDSRAIYWYFDKEGGKGKSAIATYLCLKYPKNVFATSGKPNDIKYGVRVFHEKRENNLKLCIFDIPRKLKNTISYEAIEDIKNGRFYSPKYESGMVIMNPPHVLIFANFEPDVEALSKDRWRIRDLSQELKNSCDISEPT